LVLKYEDQVVGDLEMAFLHDGRPPVIRQAIYHPAAPQPLELGDLGPPDLEEALLRILAAPNVASKEWIIRQYDHEVQGGSVIKPLVGAHDDGPSDAAVLRPVLSSRRGVVISCGMNPRYGELDTYPMAASAIDEAVRNCVAVGADPKRIALLDNFCWGDCEKSGTLGSLVRAALACHDLAIAWRTPFISGKDSLNNEFHYTDAAGQKQTIAIPPSLLISAMGQVDDVATCVTMDLKAAGNRIYLVGQTHNEMGGSHFALVRGQSGGQVPAVDPPTALATFHALHAAIQAGLVRACHDLSEGGLAVAAAEMAFAGGLGMRVDVSRAPRDAALDSVASLADAAALLFSESNSRFLVEVAPEAVDRFESTMAQVPCAALGEVTSRPRLVIQSADITPLIDAGIAELQSAWQSTFSW
jgi:phosphoribosylformylglycinamidine synthase